MVKIYINFNLYTFPDNEWYFDFKGGGYVEKILIKIGVKQCEAPINWTLESWKISLEALEIDSDIAFFGDSITSEGRWQEYFPEYSVVNLGLSGDNILGMDSRVDMISSVKPEKIFILGGINSLINVNSENVINQYQKLIDDIRSSMPKARLYIQSVLPVSKELEESHVDNIVISAFNEKLKELAEVNNAEWVDIYSLYERNGCMNPELTKDGIHLKSKAYAMWAKRISKYIKE